MSSMAQLHLRIASRLAVLSCGVGATGIGALALIGYAIGLIGLYQWTGNAVGMAPNTAVGFVLTGIGLSTVGSSNRVWRVSDATDA